MVNHYVTVAKTVAASAVALETLLDPAVPLPVAKMNISYC
jgi:hypothetical protein